MATEAERLLNLAYTAFACWADALVKQAEEVSIDFFEFETLVAEELRGDGKRIEKAWRLLQRKFKPSEPALNMLAFPPVMVKRALTQVKRMHRLMPELVDSLKRKAEVYSLRLG